MSCYQYSQLKDVCESCMSGKLTFGIRMQKFCRFCCGELIENLGNADSRHAGTMLEG